VSTYAQFYQLGPFFSGGTLQASAKLYHYAAGTSTLKDIYEDRAKATPLDQPFVSDANGVFNFFGDGIYKLIICGPDSVGPASDVLYTLDNFQILDPQSEITWGEGVAVASASTIALGPEIWTHISGSTNISTITGTNPWAWVVFDGNLTLNYSANLLTPASINLAVRAGDVVLLLNEGSGVWRVASHYQADGLLIATQDSRTNTSDVPLTVRSTTSGTPAAGMGTDILLQAESADEAPSDVVQIGGTFSDVGSGTEDSYFRVLLRVAGAALTECWRWAATGAYKGIFTHANSADRTYTLPNWDWNFIQGLIYAAPSSIGSGSTRTQETFSSATGNLSGIHFYTGDFTLNSAHTLTIPAGSGHLVIACTGTLTINGTITGVGGGLLAGPSTGADSVGSNGTSQPGGGGGGNSSPANGFAGGGAILHGLTIQAGGAGGVGAAGTAGTQITGSSNKFLLSPYVDLGGATGGSGINGGSGGSGGRGGASIALIAPTVVLAATATFNTSGSAGGNGAINGDGGGGGGGAGNLYVVTRSFTDSGATITLSGGAGGSGSGIGYAGAAGAAGVKQIMIYA